MVEILLMVFFASPSLQSQTAWSDRETIYRKLFLYNSFKIIHPSGYKMQKLLPGLKTKQKTNNLLHYFSFNYVQYLKVHVVKD